jgi:hypothetical protein
MKVNLQDKIIKATDIPEASPVYAAFKAAMEEGA